MAQNTNTSLSLANLIDILNKAQSIDRRYGVYDTEADALTAMAQYGLDGRLVAVYTDKANGVCKLYKYNEVHHRLDSVGGAESDDTKLDKIWAEIEEQTETLLTDYVVVNQGNQLYKTTVAKLLANVADTEIFVTVSTLPATGVENKIYLVPSESPEDQNQLEEWIWIEDDWELIGNVSVDLSNYFTKAEINSLLSGKADNLEFQEHKGDLNVHVTSSQKLNWNDAYTHSKQPHAPSNAQKNVQSDWEQSDNSTDDFIKNKPTKTSQFINDGENGTDKYAQLKDIYKGNALLSYGIVNIPGTYQYDVWADKYIINGILYEERIEDTVTLSPADSTYDRIDRIVINTDGDIIVKEGIPAENPVSPDIDPATEVEVRFILVKANTAEPDINTIQVYDENLGSPNEWDSEVLIGVLMDFDNTEFVSKGSKSLKFGETLVRQRVRFIAGSFIELNTIGEILFDIRTTSEDPEFSIKIGEFPEIFIRNRIKGFLADGNWHTVSISAGELRELNPDYNGFDQIYLQKWDFPTPVWFDNIRIIKDDSQGGGTTPIVIQRTSEIPINDGATGDSRYVEEKDFQQNLTNPSTTKTLSSQASKTELDKKLDKVTTGDKQQLYGIDEFNEQEVFEVNEEFIDISKEADTVNAIINASYTNNIANLTANTVKKGRKYVDIETGTLYIAFEDDIIIKK